MKRGSSRSEAGFQPVLPAVTVATPSRAGAGTGGAVGGGAGRASERREPRVAGQPGEQRVGGGRRQLGKADAGGGGELGHRPLRVVGAHGDRRAVRPEPGEIRVARDQRVEPGAGSRELVRLHQRQHDADLAGDRRLREERRRSRRPRRRGLLRRGGGAAGGGLGGGHALRRCQRDKGGCGPEAAADPAHAPSLFRRQ